jgi:hypothetical protein
MAPKSSHMASNLAKIAVHAIGAAFSRQNGARSALFAAFCRMIAQAGNICRCPKARSRFKLPAYPVPSVVELRIRRISAFE